MFWSLYKFNAMFIEYGVTRIRYVFPAHIQIDFIIRVFEKFIRIHEKTLFKNGNKMSVNNHTISIIYNIFLLSEMLRYKSFLFYNISYESFDIIRLETFIWAQTRSSSRHIVTYSFN